MKKILAIAAVLMLVPFTAFALEMMADTALDDVTAQAGVSIDINNIQLDFAMNYLAWGDSDGLDGNATTTSWVGISGLTMTNIVIDRLGVGDAQIDPIAGGTITTSGTMGTDRLATLASQLVTSVSGGTETATAMRIYEDGVADYTDLSFLTIDVGTNYFSADMSEAIIGIAGTPVTTNHTAVAIGIPTISIYVGSISDMDIALGSSANALTEVMGTLAIGGMQVDLKGGSVYIMAH